MYISDNKGNKTDLKLRRHLRGMVIAASFTAVFGGIYEYFSHEVYSYFMIYAFLIPLLLGALPYSIISAKGGSLSRTFLNLWNSAIAAFTVGCVFKGVLDIYGTTNRLLAIYVIMGAVFGLCAFASLLRPSKKYRQPVRDN